MTTITGPVRVERLDNGLTVLVRPLPGVQAAATCLHYGVGFRNEPVPGAAHLAEHVLSGFSAAGAGYLDDIARLGGSTNARTSLDYTQYLQVLPAGGLDVALRLERDRMATPALTAERVGEQVAVVQAEIRRNILQRPHGGLVLFGLPALLFPSFAHGHNGYGDVDALAQVSPAQLQDFVDDYCQPANAWLGIAGDVDPDAVVAEAREVFGGLPRAGRRPIVPPADAVPETGRTAVRRDPSASTACTAIGLRTADPARSRSEYLATVALTELLDATPAGLPLADASGLRFRWRVNRTGNPFDVLHPSMVAAQANHPAELSGQDVEDQFRQVLGKVADAGSELDVALTAVTRQAALAIHSDLDSLVSLASWTCIGTHLFADPCYYDTLPGLLRAVPAEDVRAVADALASAPAARITSLPSATMPCSPEVTR
ncbi:M16 family metallopeptidase [Micromonospora halophytica]|uniref:Predicted Zn-dependent peptidase n=1 Tax=Micromonospora halophytica TaxID=47864 RepID=A0A1C5IBB1_9ACTN|nr:pitrilysin family protein [Micromonospora halophytica]SCG55597.1 Predicted Zn-dependent peptidase [Micromonospora halophytica]